MFGQGLARAQRRFVFACRGNLGFAFEKVLVAQERRIAAAFPHSNSTFHLLDFSNEIFRVLYLGFAGYRLR